MNRIALSAILIAGLAACDDLSNQNIVQITGTTDLSGRVLFDANGNRQFDASDPGIGGVAVNVIVRGTSEVVASDTTNATGDFLMSGVPVGTYLVQVDPAVLGDSLLSVDPDTIPLTLGASGPAQRTIGLGFPLVEILEARLLPSGRKVFVRGFAANDRTAFNDSTVHLVDGPHAIRATNVFRASIRQGDSVRFLGRTAVVDGQPVIDRVTTAILAFTGLPVAEQVATATARTADGGRLDANQVRMFNVTIIDTSTVAGNYVMRLSDGSGDVDVVVTQGLPVNLTRLLPDSVFSLVGGVLVPQGGAYVVKVRGPSDIVP